jgi:hypothetical protein
LTAAVIRDRDGEPLKALTEVGLVTGREMKKNLRGVKGIILLALSLIGGTLTALLLVSYFQRELADVPPEMLREAQKKIFTNAFHDAATGEYLADAPLALVMMLNLCVWLAPALIWLAGFDAISGEVQHRTIRYWSIRTRRTSYYVGKFLGLWGTVGVMT